MRFFNTEGPMRPDGYYAIAPLDRMDVDEFLGLIRAKQYFVLLARWRQANPTPLVLLVDEIDSLIGDTLLSVLRQLRAGYQRRPEGFPQRVVLCGVRDIRDYRIRSSTGEVIAGGSPFNVAAKSMRMGDIRPTNSTGPTTICDIPGQEPVV